MEKTVALQCVRADIGFAIPGWAWTLSAMKPCRNILAALLGILLSGCGEVVTGNYATYQDAVSDDLFRRGWLPDILPQTTINIRTTNNLDINTSSGSFEMPKSDISMFKSRLSKMPDGKYAYSYGEISKDPTWVFAIGDDKGNVTYVFSSD